MNLNLNLNLFSIAEGHAGDRFSWTQRISAIIEVARGIQFLHTGIVPGIFANHLKITDVLLDADFRVKISKYNLSLLAEDNDRLVCQKIYFFTDS